VVARRVLRGHTVFCLRTCRQNVPGFVRFRVGAKKQFLQGERGPGVFNWLRAGGFAVVGGAGSVSRETWGRPPPAGLWAYLREWALRLGLRAGEGRRGDQLAGTEVTEKEIGRMDFSWVPDGTSGPTTSIPRPDRGGTSRGAPPPAGMGEQAGNQRGFVWKGDVVGFSQGLPQRPTQRLGFVGPHFWGGRPATGDPDNNYPRP